LFEKVVSLLFEVFMTKHTPGPWFLGVDLSLNYWPTHGGWAPLPPTIENKKLQALAPDLLRLLKESVSTLAASRRPIEDWLNESRTLIQKIESEK
jgi:hypothetical protein